MIKFYRKIRQKLLSEGKIGKYIKYALGEIILVVIGILIALYINDWNQNQLDKNEVTNYFKQIKTELESDIIHFNDDITKMNDYTNYLNKVSEGKYEEVDLSHLLMYLTRNRFPRNFGISYNKMLESGIIKHLKNNEISNKLQAYYLTSCTEYNTRTQFHSNFISDNIEGPLLLILDHKKGFLVDPKEVIEELENGKLKSLVNWQLSYFEYHIPEVEKDITQATELINLINKKITKG